MLTVDARNSKLVIRGEKEERKKKRHNGSFALGEIAAAHCLFWGGEVKSEESKEPSGCTLQIIIASTAHHSTQKISRWQKRLCGHQLKATSCGEWRRAAPPTTRTHLESKASE